MLRAIHEQELRGPWRSSNFLKSGVYVHLTNAGCCGHIISFRVRHDCNSDVHSVVPNYSIPLISAPLKLHYCFFSFFFKTV